MCGCFAYIYAWAPPVSGAVEARSRHRMPRSWGCSSEVLCWCWEMNFGPLLKVASAFNC